MLSASELHSRGLVETNAGRHAHARTLFTRALERDPDPELTARIDLSLAHAEFAIGSTDDALELCRRALAVVGISPQVRGLCYSQLGVVHSAAGNGEEALHEFGRALQLLDESPEPRATALLNRGNVHLQRMDIKPAVADFGAARDLAHRAGLEVIAAKAEHNLGYTLMLAGDLTSALRDMENARPVLEELSPTYRAVCNQDRAEVLMAAGMVTDAEEALREAARAYGSRGLRQRQGEAELVLSRLMLRQDASEAGRIARQAARRFRVRGSEAWALKADLVALSAAVAGGSRGRRRVTDEDADALAAELTGHGLAREAKIAELQVVQLELRDGRVEDASRRLSQLRVDSHEPLPTRLLDREVRADLARRRGRRTAASAHVRRGLASLHEWQSSFGSIDLQSSLVGHGRRLALQGLSLAVDDGRPEVVFEWAERARALASRVSPLRPPPDEDSANDLSELRQLQTEIEAAERGGVVPRTLIMQANRLRARIRQRAWYGEGSGVVTEPAGLDEALSALSGTDGAIVSYLVVEGDVWCLAVTGVRAELVSIGPFSSVRAYLDGLQADLDMAAVRLSATLAGPVRAALAQRMARLSDLLVRPVRDRVGDGPLVVVPSGSLAGVPWSMLPGFAGRPLTVPRSASSWLADREEPFRLTSAGFVAGPRVDRAEEEVGRASVAWAEATVLAGDGARSVPVVELASSVEVFHAAAHGRHSADNPLFSGLELSDGPWFGYDIDQLGAIPNTVVLSACEVGRSSVRWGEETIGMTVAWLHAGARCVIASPALVNDDVACEVLAMTHARLARGATPSAALATAVIEVEPEAPAPFLCFGNGW